MTTPSTTVYLVPSTAIEPAQEPKTRREERPPVSPMRSPKGMDGAGPPADPPEQTTTFYHAPSISEGSWRNLGMCLLITVGIFALLPVTRYISQFRESRAAFMTSDPIEQLPPILPEELIEEKPEEEEQEKPELKVEDQEPLTLSELQASLNVGTGDGSGFGARSLDSLFFNVQDIGDLVFEIKDLDGVPRLISAEQPVYPHELKRDRIEGDVVLLVLINTDGRVMVLGVEKSTNREFELAAIRSARSARYTPPMRNGQKVNVRFRLPYYFRIGN